MVSDEHLKMRETEKTYVGCVTLTLVRAFSWWAGQRDLKIYSLVVFQEVAQWLAGLKYKAGHENLLFSLRMFSFFFFRVGRGLG